MVKTLPSDTGFADLRSLVEELRSHMPNALRPRTQNIKQKQNCKKFNKDLKEDLIKKRSN